MKKFIYNYYCLIVVLCTFFSCSEMDDVHMEYVKGGEISYTKRADSVVAYAGKNRIKIAFENLGPNVNKVKITWNHQSQSVEVPVEPGNGSLSTIITDLPEGAYSFDIYTYDKYGNVSVPHTITGNVYGESYSSTLRVRAIDISNIDKNNIASIDWFASPPNAISTEITYTDNTETDHVVYAPSDEEISYLPSFVEGRNITYKTLFLPEEHAIDTFYSETATREIIRVPMLVDKSLFLNVKLPGDDWAAHTGNGNWNIERAWDHITDNDGVLFHATRTGFPSTITIDIGTLTQLTHMKMWGRTTGGALFNKGVIRKFEIYGRADAPDPNDGSWTGWTLIMDGTSVKPSGLPVGQNTDEDLAYALAGEDYNFFADTQGVRYIRFNVQDSWGPDADNYWYINEISLWGFEQ